MLSGSPSIFTSKDHHFLLLVRKEQEHGHNYGREREQDQKETMGTKRQGAKETRGQAPVVQDDGNKSKHRLSPSKLVLSQDDLKGI